MIYINDINLFFGERTLFDHISLSIDITDRIGLVGRNGSGKSTLLKAIHSPSVLDSGTIALAKGKHIAYMPQEVVLLSEKSLLEETISVFARIIELQDTIKTLEEKIQSNHHDTIALEQLAIAYEELAQYNPEHIYAQAKQILNGLGFKPEQFDAPVNSLSVGWKMRVVLAKLLLKKADFYLFDEPTNHLDIVAKDWFIDFLEHAPFGFILVCHERYLMQRLCTSIFELEYGTGKQYSMRYHDYEIQKEADYALLVQKQTQQQKEIKRKQQTIERFRASASKAKMAKSMERALEKEVLIELPPSPKNIHFHFKEPARSGRIVLEARNVAHSFGNKKLFEKVSFQIERGERVALIAPNGVGKTTLFNLIIKNLPLQQGSIENGYNVHPTIFHQDQHTVYDLNDTIFNNVLNKVSHKTDAEVRSMLGSFLFTKDEANKAFKVLSGGEKNRVAMATVLLQDANFLLLDEPTNHLDIYAKDILLSALKSYKGTIFFVSHDHDFINNLATRIIELTPQGSFSYQGNYDSYIQHTKEISSHTITHPKTITLTKSSDKKNSPHEKFHHKQIQQLEKQINKLEKRIADLELSFTNLLWGTKEYEEATQHLSTLKKELAHTIQEWENLH